MNKDHLLSPQQLRFPRTDSLKDQSPQDIDLLKDSYQIQPSKQINQLNTKLGILQNKVKSIKTQQAENLLLSANQNVNISNLTLADHNFQAGRFHKKNTVKPTPKNGNNNSLFSVTVRNNNSFSHQSRNSNQSRKSLIEKDRQLKSMKKEMMKLRMGLQKSQRSRSRCSEKLSQSKQNLINLQKSKRVNQRLVQNLVKDLKKSENIRKKQKETIVKQKRQIDQLKKLVIILKGTIRV